MAIEVPVENYLEIKCVFCGYGFNVIHAIMPNKAKEIVLCERLTKECQFTPFIDDLASQSQCL